MNDIQGYFDVLKTKLNDLIDTQSENIDQAADMIVESFLEGGRFYAFGTGHSHMIVEELFTRAGGLAFVKAILPTEMMLHELPTKSSALERLPGYAKAILDLYPVDEKDVFLIISNSGRNSAPVEMAMEARKRGAKVICITSMKHSTQTTSRQKDGKKLYEVSDLVIDNQAEYGDAAYYVGEWKVPVAGTSDFIGIAIVQTMTAAIASKLAARGEEVPVFRSGNVDGAAEINYKLHMKYVNAQK
ncbi:MAG: SIS domain-containing protein [Erysipelotrichaceae bacterium]|nr:SIS domain-containing protein [Erysipelotrichaceae bacterium]